MTQMAFTHPTRSKDGWKKKSSKNAPGLVEANKFKVISLRFAYYISMSRQKVGMQWRTPIVAV
jgi:hypothetical protein